MPAAGQIQIVKLPKNFSQRLDLSPKFRHALVRKRTVGGCAKSVVPKTRQTYDYCVCRNLLLVYCSCPFMICSPSRNNSAGMTDVVEHFARMVIVQGVPSGLPQTGGSISVQIRSPRLRTGDKKQCTTVSLWLSHDRFTLRAGSNVYIMPVDQLTLPNCYEIRSHSF